MQVCVCEGERNRGFDLRAYTVCAIRYRQVAPTNRRYTTWIGGSNLAQLDGFDAALLWAEDWAEHGESILHGDR